MRTLRDIEAAIVTHEGLFRNILADMRDNRHTRPAGQRIPDDLDFESPIEYLLDTYVRGVRTHKFTIRDFEVDHAFAHITFSSAPPDDDVTLIYTVIGDYANYLRRQGALMGMF